MKHYFDVDLAKEIGVNCAILLENIYFWTEKNKANNKHFYDNNYWTYNSVKAFTQLFPYMTERGISYALTKLEDNGYIITGNYNKVSYDRTKWYSITERGLSVLQNCKMEVTKSVKQSYKYVEPIPDINTDNKPEKDIVGETPTLPPYNEIIDYLNSKAGTNYRSSSKDNQKWIKARLNEGYTLVDFQRVIDNKVKEWKYDKKMAPYLRPSTLFSPKFEAYLNQNTKVENVVSEPSRDETLSDKEF